LCLKRFGNGMERDSVRMQNSQLSSAVDRRRLTLLSDAVPGLVPVTTSDTGSVDRGGGSVAEDIGDAVLVRPLPCRLIAGGEAGGEQVARWPALRSG
jgi:hypothetical protein